MIKYKKEPKLEQFLEELLLSSQKDAARNLKVKIDRDPVDFV